MATRIWLNWSGLRERLLKLTVQRHKIDTLIALPDRLPKCPSRLELGGVPSPRAAYAKPFANASVCMCHLAERAIVYDSRIVG